MASKPELRKELLRNSDRAISNLEAIPGGFNKLTQLYSTLEPLNMKEEVC
jgi:ubiquilin